MIKSTPEIKKFWNASSTYYSNNQEQSHLFLNEQLAKIMELTSRKNILEVGCGSGLYTVNVLPQLQQGTQYISSDLSSEMLHLAEQRLKASNIDLSQIDHQFLEADSENLSMIADDSVDCYLASLVLHFVESPKKMLREAQRVLKKGGVFGCSVWGNRDNSPYFTILQDRLKEFNVDMPNVRSPFHLGNKEKLVQMGKNAGLDVQFCWTENVLKPINTVQDLDQIYSVPSNKKTLAGLDSQQVLEIKKATEKIFLERKKTMQPFGFESLLMVAYKE